MIRKAHDHHAMSDPADDLLTRLLAPVVRMAPHERRAVLLAFACHFLLLGSYYILKPVRDTMATVFGTTELQYLFTGTFIGTLLASPLYSWAAARVPLRRLLPGVFWFWLANVLLFEVLMHALPASRWVAGAYYIWFSVVNLFMVSVFWTLMADIFTASQAPRLFGFITAGGSTGAIAGPLVTRFAVQAVGIDGTLLIAAGGFFLVIALVHVLMREKERLAAQEQEVQPTTLAHRLAGGTFDGFVELMKSAYSRRQAAFMLLMTGVATVAYFLQTDVITYAFPDSVERRAVAISDISIAVNVLSALVLLLGLPRYVQRFGVTAGLLLNPLLMLVGFAVLAFLPTLRVIQALQVLRQAGQYAIARPSREMCFTVVPQEERYRTKNVIDTVVYRLGDVVVAWMQAGLRLVLKNFGASAGLLLYGSAATGVLLSAIWGLTAVLLGRRYEQLRAAAAAGVTPALQLPAEREGSRDHA
jgi:AAA family ATP:ADP antiporter